MRTASLMAVRFGHVRCISAGAMQEFLLALCTETPVTDRTIEVCSQLLQNENEITPEQRTAALRMRGYLYYRQGNFDRAISDFDKVIQSTPEDSPTYAVRDDAYLARGVPGSGDVRRQ
jgi:tetratricopeptide (TPR) repeat protein